MTYQELIEYLLPELSGVPVASVRDAVGWAVREFCKEADVWLVGLPVAAGSNTLDAGADLEPLRVRGVTQGGNPLPARLYEQPTSRALIVRSELQDLVAEVAVRPRSIAYQGLTEDFVSEHQDALVAGALMRLYAQPEKPWSNPALAGDQHRIFLACYAHARQRAVLGHATGGCRMRVPRFT